MLYLPENFFGLFEGRSDRQLNRYDNGSLVLLGQVPRWHPHIQNAHGAHDEQEKHTETLFLSEDAGDNADIHITHTIEGAIETQEEGSQETNSGFRSLVPLRNRFEKRSAKHRGQNKGHHDRKKHRRDDRRRELSVDDASGTWEKDHGAEDGRQNQTNSNERTLDLAHGLAGRLPGRQPLFAHHTLDVLHDDDGIIDKESYGEDHSEHRQHIDGVAKSAQNPKGTEEYHRHRDGGYQGGPQVPHENKHDEEDENDRLDQGFDHLLDGHSYERRRIIGVDNLHAGGKEARKLIHLLFDPVCRIERVCTRLLANGEHADGVAIEAHQDIGRLACELGPADILDVNDRSIRVCTQWDCGELLRRHEHRLYDDGGIKPLPRNRRSTTELACGDFHVVSAHRCHHIVRGHSVLGELVRVEPHTHGISTSEKLDFADPRHARENRLELRGRVVIEIGVTHAPVVSREAEEEQIVAGGLGNGYTPVLHHSGQRRHGELELVLNLRPSQIGFGARSKSERDRPVSS